MEVEVEAGGELSRLWAVSVHLQHLQPGVVWVISSERADNIWSYLVIKHTSRLIQPEVPTHHNSPVSIKNILLQSKR